MGSRLAPIAATLASEVDGDEESLEVAAAEESSEAREEELLVERAVEVEAVADPEVHLMPQLLPLHQSPRPKRVLRTRRAGSPLPESASKRLIAEPAIILTAKR